MKHLPIRISALALLSTLAVSAELAYADEQPVGGDEKGSVTIDTDTVKPKGSLVRAGFWAYTGDERIPVVAMVQGCHNGAGKISYNILDPDKPEAATKVAAWSSSGGKMIDRMAAAACRHARGD